MRYRVRGFTLLELIVVIAIIGVLSVIIIPSFKNALARANDTKLKQFAINLEKRYDVTTKYDFDEGGGLLAKDTSINQTSNVPQNDLTIPVSGVSYSPNTYSSSSQYSLSFDGTNYVVSKSVNSPQLDGKSFSVSLWLKKESSNLLKRTILSKDGGNGSFNVAWNSGTFGVERSGLESCYLQKAVDTDWHHYIVSFDATSYVVTIYLDSKKEISCIFSNSFTNSNIVNLVMGPSLIGLTYMDDLRFYQDQVIVR